MMNCKPTSLQHGLKLLAVWCAALTSPCQAQTITWRHPTPAGRYKVESAIPDPRIAVRVTTKDGQVVDSAEALATVPIPNGLNDGPFPAQWCVSGTRS